MHLLHGEFGFEGLRECTVAVAVMAGSASEDLQDPLGGGGCAVTELGGERDVLMAARRMRRGSGVR